MPQKKRTPRYEPHHAVLALTFDIDVDAAEGKKAERRAHRDVETVLRDALFGLTELGFDDIRCVTNIRRNEF